MSDRTVDLRSDTLTLPTEEMREAMATAPVGDDVYGDDPTVNRLQELAAAKMGMEAALYVPSGTMGNSCALLAHARMGEEVIFEEKAHMYSWECANFAVIAGLGSRAVAGEYGVIAPDQLEGMLRPDNVHYPKTTLVCIENSHNNWAGAVWTPAEVEGIGALTKARGLKLHMDGARIFNAAVAMDVDVVEYTRHIDSIMFCVSKGLSGPIGSLLCGTRAFIEKAHAMRKRLGGSMRQSGIVAAAGIIAIEKMVDRLADDHENVRRLAAGLGEIEGFQVSLPPISTNILLLDVSGLGWSSTELLEKWAACGIRCNPRPPSGARLVTHRHIEAADIDYVVERTRELAAAG